MAIPLCGRCGRDTLKIHMVFKALRVRRPIRIPSDQLITRISAVPCDRFSTSFDRFVLFRDPKNIARATCTLPWIMRAASACTLTLSQLHAVVFFLKSWLPILDIFGRKRSDVALVSFRSIDVGAENPGCDRDIYGSPIRHGGYFSVVFSLYL
jgi:hypothetical protein